MTTPLQPALTALSSIKEFKTPSEGLLSTLKACSIDSFDKGVFFAPLFKDVSMKEVCCFVKEKPEIQSDLVAFFKTRLGRKDSEEGGVLITLKHPMSSQHHPLLPKFAFHKKAAQDGIALPIEPLILPENSCFHLKIGGTIPLAQLVKTKPLSMEEKICIAKQLGKKILQLHTSCKLFHQSIHPWSIVLKKGDEGLIEVYLTNFLATTSNPLGKEPLFCKNSTPPEFEYAPFMTPKELEDNLFGAETTDLYNLGQTLFFLFKGTHFEKNYNEYLTRPHVQQRYFQEQENIGCLDDFSVLRDDTVRDFLQFHLKEFPEEVYLAIRGLLRTIPNERISLKKALQTLEEIAV
jgi:hypothetical protein